MSGDGGGATDQEGVATASYVSTTEILERESRLLARRQLARPGFWRSFARRHVLAAVLVVAVIAALAAFVDRIEAAGAVRGIMLMLFALGVLTAFDVWLTRRRIFQAHRTLVTRNCPPGTVVSASYSPREFSFSLPGHRIVLETSSFTNGLHEAGLLHLEQENGAEWVVPDELLGPDGLAMVSTVLGERLVER